MQSFSEADGKILDCAVARVLGASEGLNIRLLKFADPRPYLLAEGKAALTIQKSEMKVRDSGLSVGRNDGWRAAPTERIAAAIKSVRTSSKDLKLIGQPTSWLCASLGEEEDDLRRFTFAYGGLELLATQAEKLTRRELIDKIKTLDSQVPVTELLWPSTNEDYAMRNLVFRFAAMATVYSPDTAIADVEEFRGIARARNDLFHGSEQTISQSLSMGCQTLLKRYVGYVAGGLPEAGGSPRTEPSE